MAKGKHFSDQSRANGKFSMEKIRKNLQMHIGRYLKNKPTGAVFL
jgi:hypothetical protein